MDEKYRLSLLQMQKLALVGHLMTAILVLGYHANAEKLLLADNGTPNYHIVCPEKTPTGKFASEELKNYLDKIGQTQFLMAEKISDRSIILCYSNHIRNIEPSIPSLSDEEYGIFLREQKVYLVGGSDRGILYAVYEFLTKLGCLWIAPDFEFYEGSSQFIPKRSKLDYNHTGDTVQRPNLKYRKIYIEEGRSHNAESLLTLVDWMPKARLNILVAPINYEGRGKVKWDNWREELVPELKKRGVIIEVGGHGYQNFLNSGMEEGKLFKNHPEWFGLDSNGRRSLDPRIVFCSSNGDAVKYLQNNILNYLQHRPEIEIFDFWPPDSERWCECDKCMDLGTPTDRHALLVSQMAGFLHKAVPNVKLQCLAYSRYIEPSQSVVLDKKVLLDFCPINQSFEYQIYEDGAVTNKAYKESLINWLRDFEGDISIYTYYRKYAWRSLPNIIPHYMQNDIRFYHSLGAKGISVYGEPGDWFTYGLNHYVFGHLAWNPSVNVDSLIVNYCTTLYGPASEAAGTIFLQLQNIVRFGCSLPYTNSKTSDQYEQYLIKLKNCIEIATAAKDGTSDRIISSHLDRLILMLEYASKNIGIMYARSKGDLGDEAERLLNDIKKMMAHNSGAGLFIPRSDFK